MDWGDVLLGVAFLVLFIIFLGSADRRDPPTADDLVKRAEAEAAAKVTVKHPEPETDRPCYCPASRWEQWRKGAAAGPDQMYGTADDIDLKEKNQ